MQKTRVGIIGCGNISSIYFQASLRYAELNIVACADLDLARAQTRAAEYGVAKACTVDELLADPEIDLVINLTIPAAHAEIALRSLEAGKHVYGEKPLATHLADGKRVMEVARLRGLRVGSAPDTFLGAGLQTGRKALDDGLIGRPVAATAFMMCHGHESWHPDPAFYYQTGGGPMFDMGPYYLTALINMLGPIRRVTGATQITFPTRLIGSEAKRGQVIDVEVPTHVAGVVEFTSGAIATLVTSFDVWHAAVPLLEVYGTEGTLSLPDPNTFSGTVRVRRMGEAESREVPPVRPVITNDRGIGAADLLAALSENRPHRASGDLALHVLEAMEGFHVAAREGRHYDMTTTCERPAPLPTSGF